MVTSDALLFLSSFIVTYNFTGMQEAMSPTGLALGFYGGIAVVGWFYQIFFMPETKGRLVNESHVSNKILITLIDKTLEEIDLVFQRPTSALVRENAANAWKTTKDLCSLRFRKVFIEGNSPRRASIVEQMAYHRDAM